MPPKKRKGVPEDALLNRPFLKTALEIELHHQFHNAVSLFKGGVAEV
jgi:hypothetical protein